MLSTDFMRFRCRNGTPLGRLVVPEVCRKSATSSAAGGDASADPVSSPPLCEYTIRRLPLCAVSSASSVLMPSFADAMRAGWSPGGKYRHLTVGVFHVESEFVGGVGRIERCGDCAGAGNRQECGDEFVAVHQFNRHRHARPDAVRGQDIGEP